MVPTEAGLLSNGLKLPKRIVIFACMAIL